MLDDNLKNGKTDPANLSILKARKRNMSGSRKRKTQVRALEGAEATDLLMPSGSWNWKRETEIHMARAEEGSGHMLVTVQAE